MRGKLFVYFQYLLPQLWLSSLSGWLARIRHPRVKTWMIHKFIRDYHIDTSLAVESNPDAYANFNEFFIRKIKPELRPVDNDENIVVSPADGTVAQAGTISDGKLLQAKGMYFTLDSLFAHDLVASSPFMKGHYATIYLAPHNYHRVHMPVDGQLVKTIYVPGKLFSVNKMTASLIPNLYARNERLICLFSTENGPMAVILVGALNVGSLKTVWLDEPIRASNIQKTSYKNGIKLAKGDELGHFNLGSTVIVLFGKNQMAWLDTLSADTAVQFGQRIGQLNAENIENRAKP